jgi:hypothetical protein
MMARWIMAIICLPFLLVSVCLLGLLFQSMWFEDSLNHRWVVATPTGVDIGQFTIMAMDRTAYLHFYDGASINLPGNMRLTYMQMSQPHHPG